MPTIALLLANCASHDSGPFGSYVAYDPGLNPITPPATLEVARAHRYRFCEASRCATGTWTFEEPPTNGAGRMAFRGREFEAFVVALSIREFGPNEIWKQRGVQGGIELDFGDGPLGPQITLGAGDAAFVKK